MGMKRNISITGSCPTQNKNETINVDYLDASNLTESNIYIKGLYDCPIASFGGSCDLATSKSCPIYNSLPDRRGF